MRFHNDTDENRKSYVLPSNHPGSRATLRGRSGGSADLPSRRGGQTDRANRYAANYRDSAGIASGSHTRRQSLTIEKVALGKRLYFDRSLSIDKSVSCATCHDPDHGFAYAGRVSTGVGGRKARATRRQSSTQRITRPNSGMVARRPLKNRRKARCRIPSRWPTASLA